MFDIGWTELMIIGIVALIVVGPKDLPVMFRSLGRFTGRLRGMAREFSRAMDDAADQAGAKDLARDLRGLSNPRSAATQSFKKAAGLDDIPTSLDDLVDEDAKGGSAAASKAAASSDAPEKAYGKHTQALAEERAAQAQARRDDAVRRANERSASFKGFDQPEAATSAAPEADASATSDEATGGKA
ncbi:MAG: Sec-independent protein translocase protein TatB [Pseudomonadota bacterium]